VAKDNIWNLYNSLRGVRDANNMLLPILTYVAAKEPMAFKRLQLKPRTALLELLEDLLEEEKQRDLLMKLVELHNNEYGFENVLGELSDKDYRDLITEISDITGTEAGKKELISSIFLSLDPVHSNSYEVNDLMVELADIKEGDSVLDPTSGVGGLLARVLDENKSGLLVGQELNEQTAAISYLLLAASGAEDFQIYVGDSLEKPQFIDENNQIEAFDKVLTVPPFAMRLRQDFSNDPYERFIYGVPSKTGSEWAFISNALAALNDKKSSRALIQVPLGSLSRAGQDKKIREKLIAFDLLEGVISIPPESRRGGPMIPTAILVFNINKDGKHKGKVQFIETSLENNKLSKTENPNEFYGALFNEGSEQQGVSLLVENADITDADLNVKRYIKEDTFTIDGDKYKFDFEALKAKTVSLEDYVSISRGFNVSTRDESEDGEVGVIKISNLQDGKVEFDGLVHANVPAKVSVLDYKVEEGDLLLSVRGTTNKVALVEGNVPLAIINPNLVRLRTNVYADNLGKKDAPKFDADPRWLQLFLNTPLVKAQLEQLSTGTTISQIKIQDLKKLQVPLLSMKEQKEQVKQYDAVLDEIEMKRQKLQKQEEEAKSNLYKFMGISDTFTKID
jgi:type I restriction enzyme M protein